MDSSFENRVQESFGSLGSSFPSWRLNDQQFHQHSWTSGRHRSPSRDDTPCSSSFEQLSRCLLRSSPDQRRPLSLHDSCGCEGPGAAERFQDDFDSDSDGRDCVDVEGQEAFRSAVARVEGSLEIEEEEGRQMRRIVGLDTTLDFEDEEDEFDLAAVGREEGDAERVYLSEVKGSKMKVDDRDCLPLSFYDLKSAPRDPRANHLAARARLEEDAREASASCTSLVYSEANVEQDCVRADEAALADVKQICLFPSNVFVPDNAENTLTGSKRSGSESEIQKAHSPHPLADSFETSEEKVKPVKRVRFALDADHKIEAPIRHKTNVKPIVPGLLPSRVPDHVRNPSKYTHYTLDWSNEDNEESNLEAFKACADMVRQNFKVESSGPEPEEIPQRIQFIPRLNKLSEAIQKEDDDPTLTRPLRFAICADDLETEKESLGMSNGALDIFESEENVTSESVSERKSIKGPKQYRSRRGVAESDAAMEI